MKRISKIMSITSVFIALSLFSQASAERFERTTELVQKVAISVGKSGVVQIRPTRIKNKKKSRRVAGEDVCEHRLGLLREIYGSKDISDSAVNGIVGLYLRNANLNPNTFEGRQLRKSHNSDDLLHNIGVLIGVYEDLKNSI